MKMFNKRNDSRRPSKSRSYWQSYSDMMAALLLMFILIMVSAIIRSSKLSEERFKEQQEAQNEINRQIERLNAQQSQLEEQEKTMLEQSAIMKKQQNQLDQIVGIKAKIIEKLSLAFSNSNINVEVDPSTGAIRLDSKILFDFGKSELKADGKEFLDKFLPTYFNVLLSENVSPYISEIIIEGHTDTAGSYMTNLKLSQERAFSVSSYIFDNYDKYMPAASIEQIRNVITANGRSWNDLIYYENGKENSEASRRVEFKFRLKDDEMIDAMMNILNSNSETEGAD